MNIVVETIEQHIEEASLPLKLTLNLSEQGWLQLRAGLGLSYDAHENRQADLAWQILLCTGMGKQGTQ